MDNHVSVNRDFGPNVEYLMHNNKKLAFEEPKDVSEYEEKVK